MKTLRKVHNSGELVIENDNNISFVYDTIEVHENVIPFP